MRGERLEVVLDGVDRQRPAVEVEPLVDDAELEVLLGRHAAQLREPLVESGVDFQLTRNPSMPAAFAQRMCWRMTVASSDE